MKLVAENRSKQMKFTLCKLTQIGKVNCPRLVPDWSRLVQIGKVNFARLVQIRTPVGLYRDLNQAWFRSWSDDIERWIGPDLDPMYIWFAPDSGKIKVEFSTGSTPMGVPFPQSPGNLLLIFCALKAIILHSNELNFRLGCGSNHTVSETISGPFQVQADH